jgi:glucose-1-phosphate thymidylyltransferase
MKGLILAGGKGSRLRPITFSMAKQLVPVANKPVIEYGLEAMVRAGIDEIGVVTGDTGEEVKAGLGDGSRWGVALTYIPQDAPLGLAHAVKSARSYLGDSTFLMYLGDNLVKTPLVDLVREFQVHTPAATILLTPVSNPSDFGVAEMRADQVVRLEEKPQSPRSNLALVGVYLFTPAVHEIIDRLKPSQRGEYEITDALQIMIDEGLTVRSHVVQGWWKDTGTVEAMLEANRLILEDLVPRNEGQLVDSRIEGRVAIGEGSVIKGSTVRGPVVIGAHCTIENSYVGPFTSIDSETEVKNSEVEYSIVMRECVLRDLSHRVEGSLIGRGVTVTGSQSMPRTLNLVMGDNSSAVIP